MSIRTKRNSRRFIAAAAAVAVAASSFIATSSPVSATPTVTETPRIAGADRYTTASLVAAARYAELGSPTTVVLASGENFPDGLAASALAGAIGAPLLLTRPDALPAVISARLLAMPTVTNVVIVGGDSAVSASIASGLAASRTVTRISGANRYATADAVAAAVRTNSPAATIGSFGGYRTAFLANGQNFPDALAASAMAYQNDQPIFLTDGSSLTAGTKTAMTAAGVQQVIVLGGTSAVSAAVLTDISSVTGMIAAPIRIGGANRYETATLLATTIGTSGVSGTAGYTARAYLVSGTNFPDALVASQLAGGTNVGSIIPVTDPLPAAVSAWADTNKATLANIRAIGGVAAVPASVVTAVKTAGTIAPLTATLTGVDGGSTVTIVFSAAVTAASAQNVLSYNWRNVAGANRDLSGGSGVYTAATRTLVWTLGAPLAAGDTFSINAVSVASAVTAGLFVAPSSLTVAPDTAGPVATIQAFTVAAAGTLTDKVWVEFDKQIFISGSTPTAAALCSSLTYTAPQIGSTATELAAGTVLVDGQAFACDAPAGGIAAGGSVRLAASSVTNIAALEAARVGNALTTATVVTDIVAPTLTSASFASTAVGGAQASTTIRGALRTETLGTADGGTVTVSPRTAIGTNWHFQVTASGTPTVSVDTVNRILNISAEAATTAGALEAVLNGDAAFVANFTAGAVSPEGALTLVDAALAAFSGTAADLTVTARVGTSVAGIAGNGWSVEMRTGAANSAPVVSLNSVTKTVRVTAAATQSASALANTLNSNAAFSALFVASSVNNVAMGAAQNDAAGALTGGLNLVSVTVTFSKPLGAALVGDLTFGGVVIAGASLFDNDNWEGRLSGVLTVRGAHGTPIVPGVATVTAATAITSRAGVAMVGTALQRTVALQSAS